VREGWEIPRRHEVGKPSAGANSLRSATRMLRRT
jgi:hypothetical protein